jgi:hypothetical protein
MATARFPATRLGSVLACLSLTNVIYVFNLRIYVRCRAGALVN